MKFRLRIEVGLKPGHSDPEGATTTKLLRELGYKVESTKVGKTYTIIISDVSPEEATTKGEEFCRRLLANPTKDNYVVLVEETE